MEVDLNKSLRSSVRNGQVLKAQSDWKNPEYITREKYAIWLEGQHFD